MSDLDPVRDGAIIEKACDKLTALGYDGFTVVKRYDGSYLAIATSADSTLPDLRNDVDHPTAAKAVFWLARQAEAKLWGKAAGKN